MRLNFSTLFSHYCSLPNEIAKIEHKKGDSRRKIIIAIENLYGMDPMVYAPFKAFESIVRQQISLLKEPVLACVDLVIDELSKAVRICTRRVSTKSFELQFTFQAQCEIFFHD